MLATFINFDGAIVIESCNLTVHCKLNLLATSSFN